LGAQHIKLADGYYHLGNIHLHYAKKADALSQYKRAAQILATNDNTHSEAFAEIMLKAGQLYLANNAVNDALISARQTLALSQELNNPPLFLLSSELVGRCL
jgi:tetratricopeptide (TPR) repeat protein